MSRVTYLAAGFLAIATPLWGQITASRAGTAEDRAALFDYILSRTMEREAFSPLKNRALDLDVEQIMLRYRDEVITADTDEKLYYALVKLSNARKDRHLTVALVPGGLRLRETAGVELSNYPTGNPEILHAPLRFATDFSRPGDYFFFVADTAAALRAIVGDIMPAIGDRLLGVNGQDMRFYLDEIEPYHRYSTVNGFWWKAAEWLSQKSFQFPPAFYEEDVTYRLERRDGTTYSVSVPYQRPGTLVWGEIGRQRYPGFVRVDSTQTYVLYLHEDARAILLDWYGFRENLIADMNKLVAWGDRTDRLDHAVIFDGTRSRGGSLGAYAMQRLSSRPFKTTFGNLKLSDVTAAFVEERTGRFVRPTDHGANETVDDGTWLADWLATDVTEALQAGRSYSNNVPFKLAHAPKDSDGILQPAEQHFTGPLVAWFSPHGGSHLDQFASIVVDNDLGTTMGMPPGGYSNTWEWEETLLFPISGRPVVQFMWSIGHTIRPNGEVLEGNPALMDEYVPVSRDNYGRYYEELLERTMEKVRAERREGGRAGGREDRRVGGWAGGRDERRGAQIRP